MLGGNARFDGFGGFGGCNLASGLGVSILTVWVLTVLAVLTVLTDTFDGRILYVFYNVFAPVFQASTFDGFGGTKVPILTFFAVFKITLTRKS